MFTAKFIINTDRKNVLTLRLTSNRRNRLIGMGIHMEKETLENILSPRQRPENIRYKSLISSWQSIIEDVKLNLARERRGDEDVEIMASLVKDAIFGNQEKKEASEKEKKEKTAKMRHWFS